MSHNPRMDFGFMSLESLVGPTEPTSSLAEEASEAKPKPKPKPKLGSGFLKKERSGPEKQQRDDDDDGNGEEEEEEGNNGDGDSSYRASKMAKTMASRSSSLFLGGEAIMARQKQEQVLISFSADHSKSEVCFLGKDGDGTVMERSGQTAQTQSLAFPYSQRMASSYNPRNTGNCFFLLHTFGLKYLKKMKEKKSFPFKNRRWVFLMCGYFFLKRFLEFF